MNPNKFPDFSPNEQLQGGASICTSLISQTAFLNPRYNSLLSWTW
jgi:hypothetical protein